VVAIERDPRQARAARERAAALEQPFEVRQGDAYAPPLADDEQESFDLVHARFLLEHLDQPARAVAPMVRAARPGGRVVLVDDDHSLMRFEPDPGGMRELWEGYCRLYERLGKDPWIGRRLVKLLVDAGARPLALGWIPYGGCAGQPSFAGLVENLARVMEGVRELLLADPSGDWSAARLDDTLRAYRAWGERPDAAVWYPLPWAMGERPAAS
jgi:SAM-dependent methyltransferase